jgi:hypothetical protein
LTPSPDPGLDFPDPYAQRQEGYLNANITGTSPSATTAEARQQFTRQVIDNLTVIRGPHHQDRAIANSACPHCPDHRAAPTLQNAGLAGSISRADSPIPIQARLHNRRTRSPISLLGDAAFTHRSRPPPSISFHQTRYSPRAG